MRRRKRKGGGVVDLLGVRRVPIQIKSVSRSYSREKNRNERLRGGKEQTVSTDSKRLFSFSRCSILRSRLSRIYDSFLSQLTGREVEEKGTTHAFFHSQAIFEIFHSIHCFLSFLFDNVSSL